MECDSRRDFFGIAIVIGIEIEVSLSAHIGSDDTGTNGQSITRTTSVRHSITISIPIAIPRSNIFGYGYATTHTDPFLRSKQKMKDAPGERASFFCHVGVMTGGVRRSFG